MLRAGLIQTLIVGSIVGGSVLSVHTCGASLAELEVGDAPSQTQFEIDGAADVFITTSVELAASKWRYLDDLPKSLLYEIELVGAEPTQRVTLRCDPTAVFFWTSSERHDYLTEYTGPIDGCATQLPAAGSYSLRARRIWRAGMPRLDLDSSSITLRVRP